MLKVNVCGTETFNGLFRKHEKKGGRKPTGLLSFFHFSRHVYFYFGS